MNGYCCCVRCRMELHHFDELDRHPGECLNPPIYRQYATCLNCGAILSLNAPHGAHQCIPYPDPPPVQLTERVQ
jgi:hypothetical protein